VAIGHGQGDSVPAARASGFIRIGGKKDAVESIFEASRIASPLPETVRFAVSVLSAGLDLQRSATMSNKEQHSNKEAKKKPALTPKEKKAAKKARKESKR
jgi:hypothetical protein